MSAHFDRAVVLLEQGRTDLAEQELRRDLALEPTNAAGHALLSLCLCDRDAAKEGFDAAMESVRLDPGMALSHFAHAKALCQLKRLNAAEQAIAEAIVLDPDDARNFGLKSFIRFNLGDWAGALEAADQGLSLDPENGHCTNMRAMSLVKLGRGGEASAAIEGALENDPNDELSHANLGWTLLEQRRTDEALKHFREALRIDPNSEWARMGLVEALKARHFVYRWMQQFFFRMARLSARLQWVVIILLLFGQKILAAIGDASPALAPFAETAFWGLFVFVILTWLADPLFSLLLRFNRFGRLALSREQITVSNWLAAMLAVALGLLILWPTLGLESIGFAAIICLVMSLPIVGVYSISGSRRRWYAVGAGALAVLGCAAIYFAYLAETEVRGRRYVAQFQFYTQCFAFGNLGFQLLVNANRLRRSED